MKAPENAEKKLDEIEWLLRRKAAGLDCSGAGFDPGEFLESAAPWMIPAAREVLAARANRPKDAGKVIDRLDEELQLYDIDMHRGFCDHHKDISRHTSGIGALVSGNPWILEIVRRELSRAAGGKA